jgi:MHS family proline/betaine transporter-like MFS transporter
LTGDKLAPSYYVLIAAVLSGLSLVIVGWRMRRVRLTQGMQTA